MRVIVERLTGEDLFRRACSMTIRGGSRVPLDAMYRAEHSPIRTQLYWIELYDIPSFVSTHLVRHKFGVEHYVLTNRDDRGGSSSVDRNTPVNHGMLLNAQALINMARKRLCHKAHPETVKVFQEILKGIAEVDDALFRCLMPECMYRGFCPEPKGCGWFEKH